nr:uncharacterized protein LOC118683405 [Bactrocera oleae]
MVLSDVMSERGPSVPPESMSDRGRRRGILLGKKPESSGTDVSESLNSPAQLSSGYTTAAGNGHLHEEWKRLPAEPSTLTEIEEILRYFNPSLPTLDWKVVRLERTEEPYRQALILLNKESIAPLSSAKGAISYGFESVVLRILPNEARADGPSPPAEVEESGRATHSNKDTDPILSDTVSTGGGSSVDDGSVFSLDRLFEAAGVDSTDEGAELALLEKSLEDEDPPN